MRKKRKHTRFLFYADKEGYLHGRGERTRTLCRRSGRSMEKVHDGSLFIDCPACLEVIRRSK